MLCAEGIEVGSSLCQLGTVGGGSLVEIVRQLLAACLVGCPAQGREEEEGRSGSGGTAGHCHTGTQDAGSTNL